MAKNPLQQLHGSGPPNQKQQFINSKGKNRNIGHRRDYNPRLSSSPSSKAIPIPPSENLPYFIFAIHLQNPAFQKKTTASVRLPAMLNHR